MLSLLRKPKRDLVISEADIQLALEHLKRIPYSRTSKMPDQWGREWVLQCLRDALATHQDQTIGEKSCIAFGPGLWALVVPFGTDLAGGDPTDRDQVWVLTRPVCTDPNALTSL